MKKRQIFLGISVFLLCLLFLAVGFLIYRSVSFVPLNVEISNITAHSFTVSWQSEDRQVGLVSIGKGGTFPLLNADTLIFYDDRDLSRAELQTFKETGDVDSVKVEDLKEYYTHHVTVTNLDPETSYEFSLGNKIIHKPHETPVRTQQEIETLNTPKPSYGLLFEKETFPATDTIVYLTVRDSDRYSTQLSAVTREDGSWYIDISNLTNRDDLTKLSLTDSYSINLSFLNHNYGRTIDITIPGTLDAPVRNIRLADLSTISLGSDSITSNNSVIEKISSILKDLPIEISASVDEMCTNCNSGNYLRECVGGGTAQCCYGSCVLSRQEDDNEPNYNPYADSDGDGIINQYDDCDDTDPTDTVDSSGCTIDDEYSGSDPDNSSSSDGSDTNSSPEALEEDNNKNDDQDHQEPELNTSSEDYKTESEQKRWTSEERNTSQDRQEYEEPDTDGDGISDFQDRCENTPSGKRINAYGCPINDQEEPYQKNDTTCIDLNSNNICDNTESPQNCYQEDGNSSTTGCAYCPVGQEITQNGYTMRCFYTTVKGYYWEVISKAESIALPTITKNATCNNQYGCYCSLETSDGSENIFSKISMNAECTEENLAFQHVNTSYKVFAQENPTYYSPSEGVIIFEESGLYCTNYLDQEYCFDVNDNDEKIIYIDVDASGTYTEGDVNLASDVTEISFKKESDTNEYALDKGFSFISFDIYNQELSDAHSFLAEINRSTDQGILSIATFQNGKWVVVGVRGDTIIGQDNFPITPGRGYLIKTKLPVSFSIYGRAVSSAVPISMQVGWNLVGISGTARSYTAESLIDSINAEKPSVNNVTRWTASKARYEGLQKSLDSNGVDQVYGFDFPITARTAYFIRNDEKALVWTP